MIFRYFYSIFFSLNATNVITKYNFFYNLDNFNLHKFDLEFHKSIVHIFSWKGVILMHDSRRSARKKYYNWAVEKRRIEKRCRRHTQDPDTLDRSMVIIRADSSCLFPRVPGDRGVAGKGRSDASCWFSANAGCFRKAPSTVNSRSRSRQKYSLAADSELGFVKTVLPGLRRAAYRTHLCGWSCR